MTQPDYEYKGMIAANWDLLRGDTSKWEDKFFFRDVIRETGQPVLDVGCGTGRLLLDFMSDGVDIDGVDNSPEMLALCREKAKAMELRPTLYQQQMEELDLPRRYRTIIVPSSSFQLVIEPDDAREAMKRFYGHLEPGGTLVMPFMVLWMKPGTGNIVRDDWEPVRERVRPEDGAIVRRRTRSTYDLANQLESTEDHYEVILNGEVIAAEDYTRSPATRWYTRQQAAALYKEAGFTDIRMTSNFTQEPAVESDELFCVAGKREA
ncbi:MAG: class I SAM-dependent methyltransferase [Chloroflexota bacterium]